VTLRRLACRLMERRRSSVIAIGLLAMLGFVASQLAVTLSWIGFERYLAIVAISLVAYGLALLVGHWGDPFELESRLRAAQTARSRGGRSGPAAIAAWEAPIR
jgi:hypothetical protein